jgi:hypothetical protein
VTSILTSKKSQWDAGLNARTEKAKLFSGPDRKKTVATRINTQIAAHSKRIQVIHGAQIVLEQV